MEATTRKRTKRFIKRPNPPLRNLPKVGLLDLVCDSRRPSRIGKFQRWSMIGGRAVAQVIFSDNPRQIPVPARYLKPFTPRRPGRTPKPVIVNAELIEKAAKFGLTVKQYLEAIA